MNGSFHKCHPLLLREGHFCCAKANVVLPSITMKRIILTTIAIVLMAFLVVSCAESEPKLQGHYKDYENQRFISDLEFIGSRLHRYREDGSLSRIVADWYIKDGAIHILWDDEVIEEVHHIDFTADGFILDRKYTYHKVK